MSNRRLSKYVTETMATTSQTATRLNIKNQFDDKTFKNACNASLKLIDPIVSYYINTKSSSCYLILSSFLRVPALNIKIGGSDTSRHCHGDAADINIYGVTPKQLFNDIISGRIKQPNGRPLKEIIDQCIYEYGSWVHVALNSDLSKPRNMFMKISNGTGYINVTKELP